MNNLVEENKELKEEILRLREKIAEYDKIYHKHSYETHERYLDFVDSYNLFRLNMTRMMISD